MRQIFQIVMVNEASQWKMLIVGKPYVRLRDARNISAFLLLKCSEFHATLHEPDPGYIFYCEPLVQKKNSFNSGPPFYQFIFNNTLSFFRKTTCQIFDIFRYLQILLSDQIGSFWPWPRSKRTLERLDWFIWYIISTIKSLKE